MELKKGYCKYCGDSKMVDMPDNASQETIDKEVTWRCSCYTATKIRKEKEQKEKCLKDIEEVLEEHHKEIAELFRLSIDAIQGQKIKKITANTHDNKTARMSMTKDGIKVELEAKRKIERLA